MSDGAISVPVLHGDWLFPTEIRFGAGRIAELGDVCRRLGLRRPLIVTDRGLAATPITSLVSDAARGAGVAPGLFAEVQENPTGGNVMRALPASSRIAPTDHRPRRRQRSDCAKPSPRRLRQAALAFHLADHEAAQAERALPIIAIHHGRHGAEVESSAIITDSAAPAKRAILHPPCCLRSHR